MFVYEKQTKKNYGKSLLCSVQDHPRIDHVTRFKKQRASQWQLESGLIPDRSRSVTSKYDGSKRAQKRLPRRISEPAYQQRCRSREIAPEIHSNSDGVEEKGERGKLGPTETSAD